MSTTESTVRRLTDSPEAPQRALAVLEDLFPDAVLGLRRDQNPHTGAVLDEAQAVVETIKIASLGHA